MKDVFKAGVLMIVCVAVVWGGSLLLTYGNVFFRDAQREVTQHSHEYVESKRSVLNSLLRDYNALEVRIETSPSSLTQALNNQQDAIYNQMAEEADRIPTSEVPDRVLSLLNRR